MPAASPQLARMRWPARSHCWLRRAKLVATHATALVALLVAPSPAAAVPSLDYVGFNARSDALAHRDVRLALSLAIDRPALAALGLDATPGATAVPRGVRGFRQVAGPTERFLRPHGGPRSREALALLSRSGWKAGEQLTLGWYSGASRTDAMARQVERDLGVVGVVVVRRPFSDRREYVRMLRRAPGAARRTDLFLVGWGTASRDAGAFLQAHACDSRDNYTGSCDRRFDRQLRRARAVRDVRERLRRYALLESHLTGAGGTHPIAAYLSYNH